MADTYFVGKINTQSTAAVGISFSIMAIIQAFGFFCGHGSGNFISRRLGARDYRSAEKMAATGFFSAFLIGCAIALVGLLFLLLRRRHRTKRTTFAQQDSLPQSQSRPI